MTEKILAVLFVFIKSVVAATGYGGVALLMAIESACIPLPSELIMPFAGYLVYEGSMKLLWVATAGAIGCNLGSLVAYEIGCYGGRPLVEKQRPAGIEHARRRIRRHRHDGGRAARKRQFRSVACAHGWLCGLGAGGVGESRRVRLGQ